MTARSRRIIVSLVAASTTIVALAVCEPDPASPAPPVAVPVPPAPVPPAPVPPAPVQPGPPKVGIVGDSITWQSTDAIKAVNSWKITVAAKSGDTFRDRMGAATEVAAGRPEVAVVNLGTNDAVCTLRNALPDISGPCPRPDFTVTDMYRDADEMRAKFGAATCFIGVKPTFTQEIADHWDKRLREGRIAGVANWKAQTDVHPEYLADGIGHLTPAGSDAYAKFLRSETQRICKR